MKKKFTHKSIHRTIDLQSQLKSFIISEDFKELPPDDQKDISNINCRLINETIDARSWFKSLMESEDFKILSPDDQRETSDIYHKLNRMTMRIVN